MPITERYWENPKKYIADSQRYYRDNISKVKEYHAKRREANGPELRKKARAYYNSPGRRKYQAAYRRNKYLNNPEFRKRCISEALAQSERRKRASRKFVDALKLRNPCTDCGKFFNPECMDFDHLPGHKKIRDIAQLMGGRVSLERLKEEIAKCELVCACCHRTRTKKRRLTRAPKGAIIPA